MPAFPISPWSHSADRLSPDGRYRAVVREASEIHMGAPTRGTLVITEVAGGRALREVEGCNPSLVWSAASDALAVPQWTPRLTQRLLIVPVEAKPVTVVPDEFRVLELHAFAQGVVSGIDSPVHRPRRFEIAVTLGRSRRRLT